MQILVYGAGYLGTVLSACLADLGTPIVCCDSAEDKILNLARGQIAFYERNLEEIIRRNERAGVRRALAAVACRPRARV